MVPVPEFGFFFYTPLKDDVSLLSNMERADACVSPDNCIFDNDGPRLEITSFNPVISEGSYSFDITSNVVCSFPFNIVEAGIDNIKIITYLLILLTCTTCMCVYLSYLSCNSIIIYTTPKYTCIIEN